MHINSISHRTDKQRTEGYNTSIAEMNSCELCGNRRLCYEKYGFVCCESCEEQLLPGTLSMGSLD